MMLYFVLFVFICQNFVVAPPVEKKEEAAKRAGPEEPTAEQWLNVEYERYLQEVVKVLESDPSFKAQLEKADPEHIKDGSVANHLDFVHHNVRSKLNEAKRREIERLKQAIKKQLDNGLGPEHIKLPEHVDHSNLETFEKEDLRKLIFQTHKDLEELDRQRKDEFKRYEMEKEHEYRQKLARMTPEERAKAEREHAEKKKKHEEHPDLKHPGSKGQLEEVWEDVDNLPKESFDMRTFFNLHDLNSDGYLEQDEVEALFQKELDKVYDKDAPEDDMREREEEMARMREHVYTEMDKDKDGLISLKEFLQEEKEADFNKDPGWKTIDEEAPIFTDEELKKFEEQFGPPGYHPPGAPGQQQPNYQQIQQQLQQQHGQVPQQQGQVPYQQGQVPQQQGQVPYQQGQVPYQQGQVPPQQQQIHGAQQPAPAPPIPAAGQQFAQAVPNAIPAQAVPVAGQQPNQIQQPAAQQPLHQQVPPIQAQQLVQGQASPQHPQQQVPPVVGGSS